MLTTLQVTQVRRAYVVASGTAVAVPVKVRTLSASGAFVVASERLEGDRLVLCLDLEDDDARFLDSQVVHRSEYHRNGMGGRNVQYTAFKLRFLRTLDPSERHESLLTAFRRAADRDGGLPAEVVASRQQTLMPLLSAIGLAVVHAWRQTI